MSSKNNEAQQEIPFKEGFIMFIVTSLCAAVIVVMTLCAKYGWKALVNGSKFGYTKTPVVARGIGRSIAWTAKSCKRTPRPKNVLPTPDIFLNSDVPLAPARQFDLKRLNRVR